MTLIEALLAITVATVAILGALWAEFMCTKLNRTTPFMYVPSPMP